MMHERRQRRRIKFTRPIRITTEDGERYSLMAVDFSMEGLGFKTTKPRNIGEILRVAVNIGQNGRSHIMNALGEVVHRNYKDKEFHIGMRFYKDPKPDANTKVKSKSKSTSATSAKSKAKSAAPARVNPKVQPKN